MPYVFISVLLVLAAWLYDFHQVKTGKSLMLVLVFAVLWLLVGLRYRMGGDGVFYQDTFYETPSILSVLLGRESSRFQPLWILAINVCRNYYVFQLLHSLIVTLCFFRFFRKHTGMVFLPMAILFFSGLFLYFTIEVQREILAVCILMLNVDNLMKNRMVSYYVWAVVAMMFHVSAIVMFLLPFFRQVRFDGRYVMMVLAVMAVFAVVKPFLFQGIAMLMPIPAIKERILVYAPLQFGLAHSLFFFVVRVGFMIPLLFAIPSEYNWMKSSVLLIAAFSIPIPVFERFLNYFYPFLTAGLSLLLCSKERCLHMNRLISVGMAALMLFCIIDRKLLFTHSPDGARYSSLFFPYVSVIHPYEVQERYDFYEGVMSEQDQMLYGKKSEKETEKKPEKETEKKSERESEKGSKKKTEKKHENQQSTS